MRWAEFWSDDRGAKWSDYLSRQWWVQVFIIWPIAVALILGLCYGLDFIVHLIKGILIP